MKALQYVCGIDEAGRGALAGPLVGAAIILDDYISQKIKRSSLVIKDGKLLTHLQRVNVVTFLRTHHIKFSTEVISVRQINNHGIGKANREVIRRLIKKLKADTYIVDGHLNVGRIQNKTRKIQSIIDADATILPTVLAGIIAKVIRDTIMHALDVAYPQYGWRQNAGYGTVRHINAIAQYGITRHHRGIFVATAISNRLKFDTLSP